MKILFEDKKIKITKRANIITLQPKIMENPNIVVIKSVFIKNPEGSLNLIKTIRKTEKFTQLKDCETKSSENVLNEKFKSNKMISCL